ncbi:MAG: ZIP family metal transporter [bacterium]
MTPSFLFIFLITLAISLLGLAGGILLLWHKRLLQRGAQYLMSFAAGSILGAAFLNLLPEALRQTNNIQTTSFFVLVGVLIFFGLEKLLILHHHTHDVGREAVLDAERTHSLRSARPLVIVGDALHNFLDGAVIAIAFLADMKIGIITALAVVAHEIPQEIGDFSILVHSGMERRRVLLWNILGALVSPLGAILGFTAYEMYHKVEPVFLALIVGNFVYLALADLVPTIKHETRMRQSLAQISLVILGIAIVWWLGYLLPA